MMMVNSEFPFATRDVSEERRQQLNPDKVEELKESHLKNLKELGKGQGRQVPTS